RRRVLKRVADVTVPIATGADQNVERISRAVVEALRRIESTAIVRPPDVLLVERIPDGSQRRWGNRGACVDRSRVDLTVREEARACVVDHVELASVAVRWGLIRAPGQRLQVGDDRPDPGLAWIALGPPAIPDEC